MLRQRARQNRRYPFKTLRYSQEQTQTWGLNVLRNVRRKNEQTFWAPIPRSYEIYRVSMAGQLDGLEIAPQRNLKVIPYILAGAQNDYAAGGGTERVLEPGLPGFFRRRVA